MTLSPVESFLLALPWLLLGLWLFAKLRDGTTRDPYQVSERYLRERLTEETKR